MDFDISNILYIVITLVAVIIGLLGKKKKPAAGDSGTPESESRPGFLENLERALTMDQEQTQVRDLQDFEADLPTEEYVQEIPVEEVQPQVQKKPGILEEYERIMSQRSDHEQDILMGEGGVPADSLEIIDLDDEPGTDYFEIVKEFDAGTAVVYSAIINRLDY
jgi:hypothetical protein